MASTPTSTGRGAARRRALVERVTFQGPGLLYLALFMAVPLVLVLVYAFFQRGRFGGIVYQPTLENFTRALDPIYLKILRDS
ncbi:MAG: hypothetical protein R2716_00050, partial [Microthrixaceae bacterium]